MSAINRKEHRKIMCRKGFTLIELVMVIVLLGILAAFIAPNLGNITSTKAGAFSDKLRADIRYAQDLAMTRNVQVRVTFAANSYSITIAGNPIADPATGKNYPVTLGAGDYVGISLANTFGGSYVEFDSLGAPYDSGGALAINRSVTVAPVGQTIIVTAQTGAVN
jgi:MSHA pilin protein MshC